RKRRRPPWPLPPTRVPNAPPAGRPNAPPASRPNALRVGRPNAPPARPRAMAYNPNLGVAAAGAGDAVRLPGQRRPRSRQQGEPERTPQTDMYAIVKTGGKQYRVQTGQRLLVERLAAEAGAEG